MIWGIFYKDWIRNVSKEALSAMSNQGSSAGRDLEFNAHRNIGFGFRESFSGECSLYGDEARSFSVVFQGAVYNAEDLTKSLLGESCPDNLAQLVACLYREFGENFVERLRGKFGFAICDGERHVLLLGRDRIGIEPLFYSEDEDKILFGSSPFSILRHPEVEKNLNFQAIHQFLLYCYNPSFFTIFQSIQKLRPGHILLNRSGTSTIKRFWKLSFTRVSAKNEEEISEQLLELMRDAVRVRMDSQGRSGVFLSGGMDSSTVVSLASSCTDQPIHTFSYRCSGESFDESRYAQIVSDHYRTRHSLVEYTPREVESVSELVRFMDEPFCDVGINIATELLGRASQREISYVLTGDGGDELFAGHPVYQADRAGRLMDRVPGVIKNPFLWIGLKIHDSEKKKDFRVKWNRFSISVQFPPSLLSHRWRVYYTPDEIDGLLNEEFLSQLKTEDPYRPVLSLNAEADAQDFLSRSLYSDYQTVVGFYLRRMDLVRRYGIESRFPMLDHRVVEYAATIPSALKIRGRSDTKYILKRAMKDMLPREIVFRKDKLGHSIPLKNWMREDPGVRGFMTELLSEESLKKRGFFERKTVRKLIDDHLSMRRNNSHRLWAMMVLELWLREHIDP